MRTVTGMMGVFVTIPVTVTVNDASNLKKCQQSEGWCKSATSHIRGGEPTPQGGGGRSEHEENAMPNGCRLKALPDQCCLHQARQPVTLQGEGKDLNDVNNSS